VTKTFREKAIKIAKKEYIDRMGGGRAPQYVRGKYSHSLAVAIEKALIEVAKVVKTEPMFCPHCRRDIHLSGFDPMGDVPKTDEQARVAIEHGKDKDVVRSALGLYRARRMQGDSVLDAYEVALRAMLGEADQSQAQPAPSD